MGLIEFFVAGEPTGKERPRICKNGTVYTPKKTRLYEQAVKDAYMSSDSRDVNGEFWEAPLKVYIIAYYGINKSDSKAVKRKKLSGEIRPTKKPDVDNVVKAILDSLNGIAYKDDKQVVSCNIIKEYSEKPGVHVAIIRAM